MSRDPAFESRGNAQSLDARALALIHLRRFEEARRVVADLILMEPMSARGHVLLAACHNDLKEHEQALEAARYAAACEPSNWDALSQMTRALLGLGRTDEAIRTARQGVACAPGSAAAHRLMATAARAAGDSGTQLAAVRRAVQIDPADSRNHVDLSDALARAERWKEAEQAAKEGLRLDPTSAVAMNNLAVAQRHRHRPFKAITWFGRATAADPDLVNSRINSNDLVSRLVGAAVGLTLSAAFLLLLLLTSAGLERRWHGPVMVASLAMATVAVVVVIGTVVWYQRLPYSVRRAYTDPGTWQQAGRPPAPWHLRHNGAFIPLRYHWYDLRRAARRHRPVVARSFRIGYAFVLLTAAVGGFLVIATFAGHSASPSAAGGSSGNSFGSLVPSIGIFGVGLARALGRGRRRRRR